MPRTGIIEGVKSVSFLFTPAPVRRGCSPLSLITNGISVVTVVKAAAKKGMLKSIYPQGETTMRMSSKAPATVAAVLATLTYEPAFAAPGPFADPAAAPSGRTSVTSPVPGDPVTIASGKVESAIRTKGVCVWHLPKSGWNPMELL
jgi:hypothetical protein